MSSKLFSLPSSVSLRPDELSPRFDGRTIRVDKASDTGPRGGYGGRGGGGFGQRGGGFGGSPHMGQIPFGQQQQQQYPMAAPPMYAPQYGGRGGYPPQIPQYAGAPAQGTKRNQEEKEARTRDEGRGSEANESTGWQQAAPYGYPDQQQLQGQQVPQHQQQPQQGQGQPQQPQPPQGGQGY